MYGLDRKEGEQVGRGGNNVDIAHPFKNILRNFRFQGIFHYRLSPCPSSTDQDLSPYKVEKD